MSKYWTCYWNSFCQLFYTLQMGTHISCLDTLTYFYAKDLSRIRQRGCSCVQNWRQILPFWVFVIKGQGFFHPLEAKKWFNRMQWMKNTFSSFFQCVLKRIFKTFHHASTFTAIHKTDKFGMGKRISKKNSFDKNVSNSSVNSF